MSNYLIFRSGINFIGQVLESTIPGESPADVGLALTDLVIASPSSTFHVHQDGEVIFSFRNHVDGCPILVPSPKSGEAK